MRSLYLETKTSKLQPSFTPNNMCYILAFKRIISLTVSSKETTILFEPKGVGGNIMFDYFRQNGNTLLSYTANLQIDFKLNALLSYGLQFSKFK